VRVRWPRLRDGILTAIFFIGYAVFRIIAEQFRVPDSEMVGPLTKGQFYSFFMIGIGAIFLVWSLRRPNPNQPTG
jgi:phosphatidylglycerol:prolipoprotein diacylglycerol transferase